jgi:formylglycine-generating enzyme required for sulfatase activity
MTYVVPPAAQNAWSPKPPSPFCIDAYEGALVEMTPGGEHAFPPYDTVKERHVRAVAKEGAIPQAYISRNEAAAACRASGKRLCIEDEWVAACRGPSRSVWPYGNAHESGICNDEGKAPLVTLYSSQGLDAFDFNNMNDPRLNQQPETLAPAGSHKKCTNDFGVFDMVGNLHEWVDDPAGTFRGGYYLDTTQNGNGCEYRTTAHDAAYHDYSTGFRCCADPPGARPKH